MELGEDAGQTVARVAGKALRLANEAGAAARRSGNGRATLVLPARAFSIGDGTGDGTLLEGTVRAHEMIEGAQRIVIEVARQRINLETEKIRHVVNGDTLHVRADAAGSMLFDGSTGLRLRPN